MAVVVVSAIMWVVATATASAEYVRQAVSPVIVAIPPLVPITTIHGRRPVHPATAASVPCAAAAVSAAVAVPVVVAASAVAAEAAASVVAVHMAAEAVEASAAEDNSQSVRRFADIEYTND